MTTPPDPCRALVAFLDADPPAGDPASHLAHLEACDACMDVGLAALFGEPAALRARNLRELLNRQAWAAAAVAGGPVMLLTDPAAVAGPHPEEAPGCPG
jgi:hypothetical protein